MENSVEVFGFRIGLGGIVASHRRRNLASNHQLERCDGILDVICELRFFDTRKFLEDVIRSADLRGTSNPKTQPREILATDSRDDVGKTFLAAGAAGLFDAQLPELEIDIVGDDDQIPRRIFDGQEAQRLRHRFAREVHIRLRAQETDVFAGKRAAPKKRIKLLVLQANAAALAQAFDNPATDVVPGGSVRFAWISKSDDELHRSATSCLDR